MIDLDLCYPNKPSVPITDATFWLKLSEHPYDHAHAYYCLAGSDQSNTGVRADSSKGPLAVGMKFMPYTLGFSGDSAAFGVPGTTYEVSEVYWNNRGEQYVTFTTLSYAVNVYNLRFSTRKG